MVEVLGVFFEEVGTHHEVMPACIARRWEIPIDARNQQA